MLTFEKKSNQKDKEDLEEIVNELELVDEEDKVPFVFPLPHVVSSLYPPPHHF